MSTHIEFLSKDSEARIKTAKQTIDNLNSLKQKIPSGLYDIRDDREYFVSAVSDFNTEACTGKIIDLTKLPKHITKIKFLNCY